MELIGVENTVETESPREYLSVLPGVVKGMEWVHLITVEAWEECTKPFKDLAEDATPCRQLQHGQQLGIHGV